MATGTGSEYRSGFCVQGLVESRLGSPFSSFTKGVGGVGCRERKVFRDLPSVARLWPPPGGGMNPRLQRSSREAFVCLARSRVNIKAGPSALRLSCFSSQVWEAVAVRSVNCGRVLPWGKCVSCFSAIFFFFGFTGSWGGRG